jgi:hypothetical protein
MVLRRRYDRKNVHLVTYNKSDDVEAKFKCSEKITAVSMETEFFCHHPFYRFFILLK